MNSANEWVATERTGPFGFLLSRTGTVPVVACAMNSANEWVATERTGPFGFLLSRTGTVPVVACAGAHSTQVPPLPL